MSRSFRFCLGLAVHRADGRDIKDFSDGRDWGRCFVDRVPVLAGPNQDMCTLLFIVASRVCLRAGVFAATTRLFRGESSCWTAMISNLRSQICLCHSDQSATLPQSHRRTPVLRIGVHSRSFVVLFKPPPIPLLSDWLPKSCPPLTSSQRASAVRRSPNSMLTASFC